MQSSRAREQRKGAGQPCTGAGRAGEERGPGQRSKAGRHRAGEQGRAARQQSRAAGEIQLANGRRGANICQEICQLSHEFVNIGKNKFASNNLFNRKMHISIFGARTRRGPARRARKGGPGPPGRKAGGRVCGRARLGPLLQNTSKHTKQQQKGNE